MIALLATTLLISTVSGFYFPMTKREAREKYKGLKFIRNDDILMKYDSTKLRVMNRRAQLGLKTMPYGGVDGLLAKDKGNSDGVPSPVINTNTVDESSNGWTGTALGCAHGF